MKAFIKFCFTTVVYLFLFVMLYISIVQNYEHEEVEMVASLICYSCIGV